MLLCVVLKDNNLSLSVRGRNIVWLKTKDLFVCLFGQQAVFYTLRGRCKPKFGKYTHYLRSDLMSKLYPGFKVLL